MAVFDMAGTTVDEDNVVYKTLRDAVNQHSFDFSLEEVLAAGAGKEKLQAIRSILATRQIQDEQLASEIFEKFLGLLKDAYRNLDVSEQPSTTEVFASLRNQGILVVLNTGYNRETAEGLIAKIGWKEGAHFDFLVTASEVEQNRPEPDMILLAMDKLGVASADHVLKVGDSTIDIEEGQNAGCRWSIGVTTGAHTRAQLETAGPDFIINNLSELLPIVGKQIQK